MGFKALDLTPLNVTPVTPASKQVQTKVFSVSRTDTVSSVKVKLPGDVSILGVTVYGSVASDAATTATVVTTAANNSGSISAGTVDVKANGATTALVQMTSLPNIEPNPLVGDISLSAVYAETGTASTTGGPWKFVVSFVR